MLTDPAQWRELEAIKVVMLLADRETASLGDPFSQELLSVKEQNITGDNVSFSSLEQNIPGFSLMFVLLTLIFSVSLALREEEVWGTSARLSVAPVPPASMLGGKLLARLVVGTAQLLLLLVFGHFVYGLRLGHSPLAMILVATAVVASMTCFAAVVAAFVRTREQAIPVGLAVAFVLASLGGLFWPSVRPAAIDAADRERAHHHVVDVRGAGRDAARQKPHRSFNRAAGSRGLRPRVLPDRITTLPLRRRSSFVMEFQTLHSNSEALSGRGKSAIYAASPHGRLVLLLAFAILSVVAHQFGRMFQAA